MTPTEARARWASFTPEERLAMAKTAPKVAYAWQRGHRYLSSGGVGAQVHWHYGDKVVAKINDAPISYHATFPEAQAACDAELLRRGFVLDNGEP